MPARTVAPALTRSPTFDRRRVSRLSPPWLAMAQAVSSSGCAVEALLGLPGLLGRRLLPSVLAADGRVQHDQGLISPRVVGRRDGVHAARHPDRAGIATASRCLHSIR